MKQSKRVSWKPKTPSS